MMAYRLASAQTDFSNAAGLLNGYTNQNIGEVENLSPLSTDPSDDTNTFYFDDYLAANTRASETEMNVWKAQRLPSFVIGYLRSPERDTEFRYRYKLGLTIPIWQGQYGGQVEAGRVNTLIREGDADLQRRQASIAMSQWGNTVTQTELSLQWFEENGLPQMNQLITTYLRLYEGGEIDYTLALRNIVDALELQEQYLNAIQQHNEAAIQLQFLSGK
ncbi:MAG: TolC family protein, partial [Bacteroidota bacterium]|nr:TolC family protein [Bacteroidota bacterium]